TNAFGTQAGDDWEDEADRFDTTIDLDYTFSDALTGGALYVIDKDGDFKEHDYHVDYVQGIVTAGAKLDIKSDLQGEETYLYLGLNEDKAESYDMFDVSYTPYAKFETWLEEDATNILAGVDAEKALNDYCTATAGLVYEDYEHDISDDDHKFLEGTLVTVKAGVTYDITDDVQATANYKHLDFDGDFEGDEETRDFQAEEITAGVSVAF
ncbi:MAG: hypothetical protein ACLFUI_06900, partial [Halanaerobiales bacterium]